MNKKIIFIILSAVFLIPAALSARAAAESTDLPVSADTQEEKVDVNLVFPLGPSLASIALLDKDSLGKEFPRYNINLEILKSPDLLASRIISGKTDYSVIPSNLASVLYNKEADIKLVGPVIWGLLYVVTSDKGVNGFEDLKGRKIAMIGRGLSPDILFRYLLKENGIDPDKDVEIVYLASEMELIPAFLTGKYTVSMMPEFMLTTVMSESRDCRIIIDVQDEWKKMFGASYPQSSLIVSGDFYNEHKDFAQRFVYYFNKAVESANNDPKSAGLAAAAMDKQINADIFSDAIPRMHLHFVPAAEAKDKVENYYNILFDFNPKTIGGKLPSDSFYLK